MLQFMTNLLIFMISILFSQLKHPLSIGFTLILQTFLISLLIGSYSKTFWFSYILFLVFLGGMLVMFIYVTSISSNEMFTISNKMMLIMVSLFILFLMLFYLLDTNYLMNFMNTEMEKFNNFQNLLMNENYVNLLKLYNYSSNLITLFLINYLFLTLIISVKITNFFYGPLRPSMN